MGPAVLTPVTSVVVLPPVFTTVVKDTKPTTSWPSLLCGKLWNGAIHETFTLVRTQYEVSQKFGRKNAPTVRWLFCAVAEPGAGQRVGGGSEVAIK